VKLSKEAKDKYVSQEVLEEKQAEENKMAIYAIMRTESEVGSDFLQISLDESGREIPTKAATMEFPELQKLTRGKFSDKSEIDLLNYLAERGWDIVAIENDSEKKIIRRKYYLRKMVSF
jgi:DNA-nicking Smr family endonuclease